MSGNKTLIKIISFLILQIIFSKNAVSQDSIFFRTGKVVAAKVTEVNNNEVKYYDQQKLSGPLYVVLKNTIKFIKYSDNVIDSFAAVSSPTLSAFESGTARAKLTVRSKSIYYYGQEISDANLLALLEEIKDERSKERLIAQFDIMKNHKRKHFVSSFGSFFVLGGSAFYALMLYALGAPELAVPFMIIGGTTFIAVTVISNINKRKYLSEQKKLVDAYNQLK